PLTPNAPSDGADGETTLQRLGTSDDTVLAPDECVEVHRSTMRRSGSVGRPLSTSRQSPCRTDSLVAGPLALRVTSVSSWQHFRHTLPHVLATGQQRLTQRVRNVSSWRHFLHTLRGRGGRRYSASMVRSVSWMLRATGTAASEPSPAWVIATA